MTLNQRYHTGELILGVIGNPTEGQIAMCICLITTAIIGIPSLQVIFVTAKWFKLAGVY